MRMGPSCAFSAMDVVNGWPEEDIARVIRDYGEEKHWRLIARRICEVRRTSAAVNAALSSSFLSFPFLSFPFDPFDLFDR
jgi:16S rRNA C1402 N4-methylase RsmH